MEYVFTVASLRRAVVQNDIQVNKVSSILFLNVITVKNVPVTEHPKTNKIQKTHISAHNAVSNSFMLGTFKQEDYNENNAIIKCTVKSARLEDRSQKRSE